MDLYIFIWTKHNKKITAKHDKGIFATTSGTNTDQSKCKWWGMLEHAGRAGVGFLLYTALFIFSIKQYKEN